MSSSPPQAGTSGGGSSGGVMPASSEPLLDVLFEHARAGLAYWDRDLRYVRINDRLADINGLPAAEHVGRTLPEAIGGLGRELEQRLRRLVETREPIIGWNVEGETPAHPGVRRHWNCSYYPVMEDGQVAGVLGAVVEVTAEHESRLREQRALGEARAARTRLDALIDASPVGIGFWNRDMRYERVNTALAELNGAAPEEHIGRTPVQVMGDMGIRVMSAIQRAMETREPVTAELSGTVMNRPQQVQHRDGAWFPVFDAAGEVVGVGGVVKDITERREAQAERDRLLLEAVRERASAEEARARAERARQEAENARGEAEAARREAEAAHRRTRILVEASARMAASLDYDETLRELAATLVPRLADMCLITTVESGGALIARAVMGPDPETTERMRAGLQRHPPRLDAPQGTGRVIRTGEVELLDDIDDELLAANARGDRERYEALRSLGLRSSLAVPLRAVGETLGALTLANVQPGRRFSEEEVVLARSLAERAALHIRNAQLFTERAHIAQTLQAGLLPRRLPDIPGAELAKGYRPAGYATEVGGDFYDVFLSGDGVWTAVLGDVAGKGPEAAAVTSLARHTLRAAALHSPRPAANLDTLNRAMLAELETTRFCTILYANLCARGDGGMLVRMANGGHLAPCVLRASGKVERVRVEGTLVGAIEDAEFEEVDVELAPGDCLLMFTDGVTEFRGRRADFGEPRLEQFLAGLRGRSAEQIAEAVLAWALEMHAQDPRDDMALIALRATP